jgi:hypothetical protein
MAAWPKGRVAAIVAGVVLIAAGGSLLGLAAAVQQRAPQPGPAQAGSVGPVVSGPGGSRERAASWACSSRRCGAVPAPLAARRSASTAAQGPELARSLPVSISIPAIGVRSRLLYVGLNPGVLPPGLGTLTIHLRRMCW